MSQAKSGIAIITSFPGTITVVGLALAVYNQDYSFGHEFSVDYGEDEVGDKRTVYATGGLFSCTLNLLPIAISSGANSIAQARLSLPPPAKLARVTLGSFDLTAFNHAQWFYSGGWALSGSNKGKATYSFQISCSDDLARDLTLAIA